MYSAHENRYHGVTCAKSGSLVCSVSPAPGLRLLSGLGQVATGGAGKRASAWSELRHPQDALASLLNQVLLEE